MGKPKIIKKMIGMREGYRKPEITKDGVTVVIDTSHQVFYLKDHPMTGLDIDRYERGDNGFTFYYNKEYQDLSYYTFGGKPDITGSNLLTFNVDHLVRSDPQGISLLYGIPVENLPDNDAELDPYNAAYDHRVKDGALPTIRAMNKDYYIATREFELRNVDDFSDRIAWDDLMELPDGRMHIVWDAKSNEIIRDFENADTSTWEVVVFGKEINLDPVGFARREGYNDNTFLDLCPVQYNQRAMHVSYDTEKEIRQSEKQDHAKRSAIEQPFKKKHKGLGF